MLNFLKKHKFPVMLCIFVLAYIVYFSYFTILRYKTLYASYFDLGIMHQTVFNTFKALQTGDYSRILELTDPFGPGQIKRMAIHNDILLAFLSPFYFISPSVDTLLIMQAIVVALGAFAVYKIASHVFGKFPYSNLLSLIFSLSYLIYPALQKGNIFDFHAVTLATTTILFMFYFWLIKKYKLSLVFFVLSIFSKEQVALTTASFGFYGLWILYRQRKNSFVPKIQVTSLRKEKIFLGIIVCASIIWFVLSIFYIIPLTRGGAHFAVGKYGEFGDSPTGIIIGVLTKPYSILKIYLDGDTRTYLWTLLGPLGFVSLLSPLVFLISLPELAINILSKDPSMRNIYYHYAAVITPFVFLSAVYGAKNLSRLLNNNFFHHKSIFLPLSIYLLVFSLVFAYSMGPLPGAKDQKIHPFILPQNEAKDAAFWAKTLADEKHKISSTAQLSPYFTSRRYFYTFSSSYSLADYIIIKVDEVYSNYQKAILIPVYERLQKDSQYELIYGKENFEVYKKI